MGRNLRLDWRALALLGALLSIIVEWPVLVCAMPNILHLPMTTAESSTISITTNVAMIISTTTTTTTTTMSNNNQSINNNLKNLTTMMSNNLTTLNDQKHKSDSNKTENNKNDNNSENFQNQNQSQKQKQQQNLMTNESLELFNLNYHKNKTQKSDERTKNETSQYLSNEQALATLATIKNEEQLNSTQRLKMLNLITNKRKRKKLFIHENINNESTTIASKINLSHSIKPTIYNLINSVTKNTTKNSETRTFNTTTINSANITNKQITTKNKTSQQQQQEVAVTMTSTSTTTSPKPDIESTLIPPLTNVTIDGDVVGDGSDDLNDFSDHSDISSIFKFSSSHHVAILSRTERSIRHMDNERSSSIVRRSSSDALKSKRLNISRNNNNNNLNNINNTNNNINFNKNNNNNHHVNNNLDRNERSTVSHMSGPSRKIQLYIKNHYIQILPDGTINGTHREESDYTILQRSTFDVGRIKFQSVATCLYLCMDACGSIYGSKDFNDDCVFNENMEAHNYNTYSSTFNSNSRKILYLALNRHGEPRKLQIPPTRSLGSLATYANALTETINEERVEQLIAKTFGENRVKHGIRQLCDNGQPLIEMIDTRHFRARQQCNQNNNNKNNSNNNNSVSHNNSSSNRNNNNNENSRNNSNNTNGQLLPNVPVANDKFSLQYNQNISGSSSSIRNNSYISANSSSSISVNSSVNSSSSNSGNSGMPATVNSDSLTNSNNSNSSSNSTNNNNSTNVPPQQQHSGPRKKKKRRKCRPHENEEEHNCHRRPQALKKKGNGNQKKCRELLQQQQKANDGGAVAESAALTLNATTLNCGPKKGGTKRHGKKLQNNGGHGNGPQRQNANANNNNRRVKNNNGGKKLQHNGRKRKNQQNGGAGGNNNNKNRNGGNKRNQKKHPPPTTSTASTTLSTTLRPFYLYSSTTHLNIEQQQQQRQYATTPMPGYDLSLDRGEREQRNVHSIENQNSREFLNAVDEHDNADDHDHDDDDDDDDAGVGAGATGETDNNEHDHDVVDVEDEDDDDEVSTNSFEDRSQARVAEQPSAPALAPETSHTQIAGGADDVYYYNDQTDYLPLGLWELFALLWITRWCLRIRT